MKKVLRNDLWMVLIAWCLYLNGYFIFGVIVSAIASIYCIALISNKNWWRVLALGMILFFLNYSILKSSYLYLFDLSTLFTASITLNVCLLNERLCRERLSKLYIAFMICFVSFAIFSLIALILPNSQVVPFLKADMISLVILIFVPYTSAMMIHLFMKEIKRQHFLNQLKTKQIKSSIVS